MMKFRFLAMAILLGWSQAGFSDHGREHVIPLFVPNDAPSTGAAGQQQGFLRIINHSDWAGMVRISGYDDMGMMSETAMLSIGANETVHVNSGDVENGNENKGLPGGIGDGSGNWRLVLASDEIDIEPLAYVRTKGDGLLISVHDIVSGEGMMHRVPIFNPGDNPNQRSSLRVINLGDAMANLTITGVDDMGAAGDNSMSATVPANGATSISAADVEDMGLGDGAGKWSLMVMSDQPIQVMSLMDTPSGHLANLSAGRREYRGAAGLWHISFDDGMSDDGILVLLPDSRMYAWLPNANDPETNHVARGSFNSGEGTVDAQGVVYVSGLIELDGLTPVGGTEDVSLSAMFRSGDWIDGSYEIAGEAARDFRGWAFTGYERGGSTASIQGAWAPTLGDMADLPAMFETDEHGAFVGNLIVQSDLGELDCKFTGTIAAVNPAFNSFYTRPVIDCDLLAFGGEGNEDEVEMFMSVMDPSDMPGMGTRAIVLAVLPREVNEISLGAMYELTR
ncbi:MAG: hypothetical protein OXP09_22685 [Gammaproteobacteria bacterium]|nr:hypothetical protein [Gammaproteobacteria bacterium]